jgi:dTDP-4-amino-4,6-dideoxygalactose transaminase
VKPQKGYSDAENAKWMMENIIYMPIHYGMLDSEIKETVDRTISAYNKLVAFLKQDQIKRPVSPKTIELMERPRL